MNRREARKHIFMLLFQYKFQPEKFGEESIDCLLNEFFEETPAGGQRDYINGVVRGIIAHKEDIDKLLSEKSIGRGTDRISSVSIAALRLAVYEILYMDDIPVPVSINEAAGLVKEYEGEEAVAFVNGILGNIQKSL